MGPVTAVARLERLDYDTVPKFALHAARQTVGARVRLLPPLAIQVDILHQTGGIASDAQTAFDVAVSYSVRRRFNK